MKPIEKRMAILAAAALFCFLFMILSFVYTSVEGHSASDFNKRLNRLKKKEAELQAKEQTSREWINIDKSYLDFKQQCLLQFADLSKFRSNLIVQMRRNMLDHSSLNIRYPADSKGNIGQVIYDFSLNGTYANIKRFIHELEGNKKMILVRQITMGKTRRDIQAKFVLEAFYVKK